MGDVPSDPDQGPLELRQQRNRFLAFAFAAADLLIEAGDDGSVQFAMGAAGRLLDQPAEALIGHSVLAAFAPQDREVLRQAMLRVAPGQRFGPLKLRSAGRDGGPHVLVQGCRLPDQAERIHLSLSEARAAAAAPTGEPARDRATGLLDREGFEAALNESVKLARDAGQDVTMTLVSLPDFEAFEARTGEEISRSFLAQVGGLLRALAVNDCSAVLGAGKFGLLQDSGQSIDAIREDLGRLARASDPSGQGLVIDGAQVAVDAALAEADAARALLYTVSHFAEERPGPAPASLVEALNTLARDSTTRISRIRQSLELDTMRVAAQPIVDLATRGVQHFELLVRFEGDRSPLEDVVFAERTGLIFDFDDAMCRYALGHLASPGRLPRPVAINISGQSIAHPPFLDRLLARLKDARGQAGHLIFEITETAAVHDLPRANHALQALRRQGFKVCLDDFGAGSASLQYLRHLDVDYIKIDGQYVRTVLNSPREAAILRAIIALARELKAHVIAEQIETPLQAQGLNALGCAYGQGYLFGRPKLLPRAADEPLEIVVPARPPQAARA